MAQVLVEVIATSPVGRGGADAIAPGPPFAVQVTPKNGRLVPSRRIAPSRVSEIGALGGGVGQPTPEVPAQVIEGRVARGLPARPKEGIVGKAHDGPSRVGRPGPRRPIPVAGGRPVPRLRPTHTNGAKSPIRNIHGPIIGLAGALEGRVLQANGVAPHAPPGPTSIPRPIRRVRRATGARLDEVEVARVLTKASPVIQAEVAAAVIAGQARRRAAAFGPARPLRPSIGLVGATTAMAEVLGALLIPFPASGVPETSGAHVLDAGCAPVAVPVAGALVARGPAAGLRPRPVLRPPITRLTADEAEGVRDGLAPEDVAGLDGAIPEGLPEEMAGEAIAGGRPDLTCHSARRPLVVVLVGRRGLNVAAQGRIPVGRIARNLARRQSD